MVQTSREYVSDLGQLADMRAFVRDACRQAWGVQANEEALGQLEVAFQEAASNVILHAYQGEPGRPIQLIVEAEPDRVSVTLYHGGRDFDPSAVPPPSFDGSRTGGFGVFLIHQLTDEVHYLHEADGRHGVRLVKNRIPVP